MILLLALMHDERGGALLSSFWYACVPRIVGASKSQFCCRPSRAVRNELVPCLRVLGLEGECRLTHGRTRQPRIEDRQTLPELRWFWSITVYVDPKRGIITNGRVASLEEA